MSFRSAEQIRALVYHSRSSTPFRSEDGEACASIPAGIEARRVVSLRSAAYREWLTLSFFGEFNVAPSVNAYREAIRLLEAQAGDRQVRAQKVGRRITFEGDRFLPSRVLLDLAAPTGELVAISSYGWEIIENLHHPFTQSLTTMPLPFPEPLSSGPRPFSDFATLFRLAGTARDRAITWLASALRPIGPYPVLVLRGPAGSGKSLFARALRALIDPSSAPVRHLPVRDHELLQLAANNWILIFNPIHRIPLKISDALCALSSGDAFEIAQPGGREPITHTIARPTILIAANDASQAPWTPTRTLANRTITIDLEPIAELRPEAAVWSEFENMRPALVATLADAIASALHNLRDIDLGNVARFADSANWAAAAAPPLELTAQAVIDTFSDPNAVWSGSNPLRDAISDLLQPSPTWIGEPTELLNQLRDVVPLASLPSSPKGLSQALSRIPGIRVERSKNTLGHRILTITKSLDASSKIAATDPPIEPPTP